MTKLPEKSVLDGSKLPKTTTGEMKDAFGKLRDYLNELFGDNSTDKETARLTLGINLAELSEKIETKVDETAIEMAVQDKVDRTELDNRIQILEDKLAKNRIPIGTIVMYTASVPPTVISKQMVQL